MPNIQLYPYCAHDVSHVRKCHITLDGTKALCGFQRGEYAVGGGMHITLANKECVTQADPDSYICKKCKKMAINIMKKHWHC